MKKGIKILIIVLIVVIILMVGALIFAGNYFYNIALNANYSKDFLDNSQHLEHTSSEDREFQDESEFSEEQNERLQIQEWAKSKYITMNINSNDGLKLNAYYYNTEIEGNSKYVIAVHGYTSKALDMLNVAKHFYDEGYNVLTPDCRGHGLSEGDYIGMGWDDRLDIIAWINEIISKDKDAQIVLYGVSMGGATVMMTSGEDLPSNVKCIIEDCGYTNVDDIFTYQLKDLFGLPRFPIIPITNIITKARAGYTFEEASSIKQVAKSKTPIFFIHGNADAFVPFYMLEEVYETANCEKDIYIVEGAGHGMASKVAGTQYWEKVFGFINKYI